MRNELTERGTGMDAFSEGTLKPGEYATIDEFNADIIRRMAAGELMRKKIHNATEHDLLEYVNSFEHGYKADFRTFWESQHVPVDEVAGNAAWQKVRKEAMDKYTKLAMTPRPS